MLVEILTALRLMPPRRAEGSSEADMVAWWAVRIGTLLAVIAGVFFGVYINQSTAAVVKFVQLLAVALAFTGFGFWLEKRLPRLGTVVIAGGWALLFFTAFAAYAVPAVQVIQNPAWGVALQGLVALPLCGLALFRRDEALLGLGFGFAYVTAFFSFYTGLPAYAYYASLILALAAALTAWRSRLRAASWAEAVGSPAVFAVWFLWIQPPFGHALTGPGAAGVFLVWCSVVRLLGDIRATHGTTDATVRPNVDWRRMYLVGSNALLLGIGGLFFWARAEAWLATFLFGAAAFCLTAAGAYRLLREDGDLVAAFTVKGAALAALFLLETLSGAARPLALLAEAAVLLAAHSRRPRAWREILWMAVWVVSAALAYEQAAGGFGGYAWRIWTWETTQLLLWLAGSFALWAWARHSLGILRDQPLRVWMILLTIGLAAGWALVAKGQGFNHALAPTLLCGMAFLAAAGFAWKTGWFPARLMAALQLGQGLLLLVEDVHLAQPEIGTGTWIAIHSWWLLVLGVLIRDRVLGDTEDRPVVRWVLSAAAVFLLLRLLAEPLPKQALLAGWGALTLTAAAMAFRERLTRLTLPLAGSALAWGILVGLDSQTGELGDAWAYAWSLAWLGLYLTGGLLLRRTMGRPNLRMTLFALTGLGFAVTGAYQWPAATTATIGVAGLATFITGLVADARPYRMVGLAGIALAIVRVFLHDLDDAQGRIIGFAVLAAACLGVAFLYSKRKLGS
ncbi:MAG: DUF2339 domain-containing protein [Opitutales bacterium]